MLPGGDALGAGTTCLLSGPGQGVRVADRRTFTAFGDGSVRPAHFRPQFSLQARLHEPAAPQLVESCGLGQRPRRGAILPAHVHRHRLEWLWTCAAPAYRMLSQQHQFFWPNPSERLLHEPRASEPRVCGGGRAGRGAATGGRGLGGGCWARLRLPSGLRLQMRSRLECRLALAPSCRGGRGSSPTVAAASCSSARAWTAAGPRGGWVAVVRGPPHARTAARSHGCAS